MLKLKWISERSRGARCARWLWHLYCRQVYAILNFNFIIKCTLTLTHNTARQHLSCVCRFEVDVALLQGHFRLLFLEHLQVDLEQPSGVLISFLSLCVYHYPFHLTRYLRVLCDARGLRTSQRERALVRVHLTRCLRVLRDAAAVARSARGLWLEQG
jgi:hypothetical protein